MQSATQTRDVARVPVGLFLRMPRLAFGAFALPLFIMPCTICSTGDRHTGEVGRP